MKKSKRIFKTRHLFSSIFMLMMLLWLTVSPAFIQVSLLEKQKQEKTNDHHSDNCNDCTSTEENKEDIKTVLHEFLSEPMYHLHSINMIRKPVKRFSTELYTAFHPQLLSPPPETCSYVLEA